MLKFPTQSPTLPVIMNELKASIETLSNRYMPWLSTIPLNLGLRWVPTWKALPNQVIDPRTKRRVNSVFTSLPLEFTSYLEMADEEVSLDFGYSYQLGHFSTLFAYERGPVKHRYNLGCFFRAKPASLQALWARVKPKGYMESQDSVPAIPNRIAGSREGKGKLRLFVIGNYIKQRLLRPLHDWTMDVLRRLPCDGTFNQPKPLDQLAGKTIVYSFDLTAATDRGPYQLISLLVETWFGRGIATAASLTE